LVINNSQVHNINLTITKENQNQIIINRQIVHLDTFNILGLNLVKQRAFKYKRKRVRTDRKGKLYRHRFTLDKNTILLQGATFRKKLKNERNLDASLIQFSFNNENYPISFNLLGVTLDKNTIGEDIFNNLILEKRIDYSIYSDKKYPSKYYIEIELKNHKVLLNFHQGGENDGKLQRISMFL
jgi:hypothetical protein